MARQNFTQQKGGRLNCFVVIKLSPDEKNSVLGTLPNKVVAPIPEEGINEKITNTLGDLPSLGGNIWGQVVGKIAGVESTFGNLQNVLAAESIWTGGEKRIMSFSLHFYAHDDVYREVYIPAKTLQKLAIPREMKTHGKGPIGKTQGAVAKWGENHGFRTFYYKSPPKVSLIVYSMLEQSTNSKLDTQFDIASPGEKITHSKSVLVYAPKCIISSCNVTWLGPYLKTKDGTGVYPSSAKVDISIDTLKIFTDADLAIENPSKSAEGKLVGIRQTYTY